METGVISMGIKCPIIREGDNLTNIVIDSILKTTDIDNDDVIGITESIVARSMGNYVTINDIVEDLKAKRIPKKIGLYSPIMSRNRFSLILRAFARYADSILIITSGDKDEQGNPNYGVNQFTGVNMEILYGHICYEENCDLIFSDESMMHDYFKEDDYYIIDARCHPTNKYKHSLKSFMNKPIKRNKNVYSGYNEDWGLLGSNKADEKTLKLFPNTKQAQWLVEDIQREIKQITDKRVEVMVYGDGCFKDPVGGIWEFADPVTTPAYTSGLEGKPNEIKIKNFADDKYKDLQGKELEEALKNEIKSKENNLINSKDSQGTTPRRYIDLLASLMDLTSGSGDKGTPVILVKNYFKNYSD